MKYLIPLLIMFCTALSAQQNEKAILLSEGFESGSIPQGWTLMDADGDGSQWEMHPSNWTDAHTGSYSIASYSWFNGNVLTPDNWLISPEINLGSNGNLNYYVKAVRDTYAQEHYQVRLSTSGTATEDFNEILIDETLPEGNNEWLLKETDLSAFANQIVHIAFVHNQSTDLFALKIDDILVEADTTSTGLDMVNKSLSRIYPNPLDGNQLTISSKEQIIQIKIFNIIGNCVLNSPGYLNEMVNLNANLRSGQYIVQVRTNVGIENLKLLVK